MQHILTLLAALLLSALFGGHSFIAHAAPPRIEPVQGAPGCANKAAALGCAEFHAGVCFPAKTRRGRAVMLGENSV